MSDENPFNDQCIVWVGPLDMGVDFFGPFPGSEEAEKWRNENVSKDLPSGWAFLDKPEKVICSNCGSEELCSCSVSLIPEKIAGIQTSIPNTVPEVKLPLGPEIKAEQQRIAGG